MSDEEIECYNTHWEAWKRLAGNKSSWELLQIGWDTYVEATGMSEHWVQSSGDMTRTVSNDVEDELTIPDDAFCMPGDEGYENDRAEVVGEGSARKNDLESDDDFVSKESAHFDKDGLRTRRSLCRRGLAVGVRRGRLLCNNDVECGEVTSEGPNAPH